MLHKLCIKYSSTVPYYCTQTTKKESKSVIHESLNCKRCVNGIEIKKPDKGTDPTDLGCWNHTERGKRIFRIYFRVLRLVKLS